jgi:riboflavin synthase
MFTGLVERLATVAQVIPESPGKRLIVRDAEIAAATDVGASIAVNGCCLTVVAAERETFAFQAGEETLARTNLGELGQGSQVNLERSLRLGDSLGGHLVTGHIDGVGVLERRTDEGDWSTFWFQASRQLMRQMASKGSIAVDGVSLTLVDVEAEHFSVALIPHTLSVTTLGKLEPGMRVNLETDVLAKYVQRQLETA